MPSELDREGLPDPSFANALSDSEVRIWINACNHEPARQALRQLLAYRVRGVSAPLRSTPEGVSTERLRELQQWLAGCCAASTINSPFVDLETAVSELLAHRGITTEVEDGTRT